MPFPRRLFPPLLLGDFTTLPLTPFAPLDTLRLFRPGHGVVASSDTPGSGLLTWGLYVSYFLLTLWRGVTVWGFR